MTTKRRPDVVLLDAEPLLLLLAGLSDTRNLSTLGFSEGEFRVLLDYLKQFDRRFVTPEILGEVSNHAQSKLKGDFPGIIERLIGRFAASEITEEFVPFLDVLDLRKELVDFGIPDVTLIKKASGKNIELLTSEWRRGKQSLYWYCKSNKTRKYFVTHLKELQTKLFDLKNQ